MDNLEPITREEILLDGGDLTPITRKEMFIKRIYDKTQSVPEPITREEYFLNKAGEGSGGDVTIEQLNVTENGTYSESGKAYSPVVVNVPTPPIPENAYLLNSLSGLPADIASFTDGTDLPMASLKVTVTPYQDLHGYDAPWAGGAGKNKFGGTFGQLFPILIPSGTTVTAFTDEDTTVRYYDANQDQIDYWRLTNVGTGTYVKTFTLSADAYYFNFTDGTTPTKMYLAIENSFSGFAPYSNICPIIGWDEAVVTRCGKNLFDKDTVTFTEGYITNTGEVSTAIPSYEHTSYIKVNPNTNYVFSGNIIGANLVNAVAFYNSKKEFISRFAPPANTLASFTIPDNCVYIVTNVYNLKQVNTIQLEEGTTATTYAPYNGATYTIDLDGTRYICELDVINGVLKVVGVYLYFDGTDYTNWRKSANYGTSTRFDYLGTRNIAKISGTILSNYLTKITIGTNDAEGMALHGSDASLLIQLHTDRMASDDVTGLMGFFTNNPLQVVYELATPITVQLSPTAIKSLEGVNNINANCGQITEVKYFKKA